MSASARNLSSPRERRGLKKAACKGPRKHQLEEDMMRFIVALSAVLIWTVLAAVPAAAADKVVLMLNWYVYGEHAPFYYGKAKGIFAAENIDLEIQEGRGSAATTQAVAPNTPDFRYVDLPTLMPPAPKGTPVIATRALFHPDPMP